MSSPNLHSQVLKVGQGKVNLFLDLLLLTNRLVLGLASAVCFVLMVVYIVLKVHCFKKKPTPKLPKSKISSEVLGKEAVANPSSFTNTGLVMSVSDLQPSVQAISSSARTIPITVNPNEMQMFVSFTWRFCFTQVSRTHSIDFNNTTNEPVLVESTSKARLTGARFLPGH